MAKIINIQHTIPSEGKPLVILPVGMYYNKDVPRAKIGARIEIWHRFRHEKYYIVRKCTIPINSSIFGFMIKYIYGEYASIAQTLEKWEAMSIQDGYGVNGFDRENAVLIEVSKTKPLHDI